MEEEKSILDCVYKTCAACGRSFTLRNFRTLDRTEFEGELITISEKFSKVCKCCEKHPEMRLKTNRLERLRAMRAKFNANASAREKKQREKEYQAELREMGLTGKDYIRNTK